MLRANISCIYTVAARVWDLICKKHREDREVRSEEAHPIYGAVTQLDPIKLANNLCRLHG